ncbi:riboflavin kinase [Streptomyces sp. R11]|uniref:Bifunctional riboflavin kinase/FMN adenylyltransferase n=1 Tax=Streptomyces sp. R11 TaxID=3238625 RepID=A0AB39NDJ6_9ACTN
MPQVEGVVVPGDRRGRQLGFPTANVSPDPGCRLPPDGVYAGWLQVTGRPPLPAAISVGANTTFDQTDRRLEAHVLDHEELDLYGARVRVTFTTRLRAMRRFTNTQQLITCLHQDIAHVRTLLQTPLAGDPLNDSQERPYGHIKRIP